MPDVFDKLMVSSPNGGGLLFIHDNQVFRLDDFNTTGVDISGHTVLRGLQPEGLVVYQGNQALKNPAVAIHDIHDVLIAEPFLYAVGTTANEILQMDMNATLLRRWQFPGENDAQHINCLALWNQRIVFSAFGDFTDHRQYKGSSAQAGFVQDLHTGERLIAALSQPHSLTPYGKNLLLANSETRELREYNSRGKLLRSKPLDGYTRGICLQGNTLYIGLSRSRNIDNSTLVHANLLALDSQSWDELGRMELPISEIYSVLAIEDAEALPFVLAGISQQASLDYRHAITTRDDQIQALKNSNERLKLLETSLNEHLGTRNKQHAEYRIALTERDSHICDLVKAGAERQQQLEQLIKRRADDALKLAHLSSCIETLEAERQTLTCLALRPPDEQPLEPSQDRDPGPDPQEIQPAIKE